MDLKEYLVRENLTIPALAKKCKLSEGTIHKILRGDTPRYKTAIYISQCTGNKVSINELVGDAFVLRRQRKAGSKLLCSKCGEHAHIVLEDMKGFRRAISDLGYSAEEIAREEALHGN